MKIHINKILFLLSVFFVISCGPQKQLTKTYYGKPTSVLKEQFGNPKTVFDRGDEKVYVYEKITELESTEINQAKLTLDPMVTPKAKKTERFYFTVKDGKIVGVKLEKEYER